MTGVLRCVVLAIALVLVCGSGVHGSLAGLRHAINAAISQAPSVSPTGSDHDQLVAVESQVSQLLEGQSVLHGLQAQVSSVTQSLDAFLTQHANDADAEKLDHASIERILSTLASLSASQKDLEERHARQSESDHQALMQLIDTQTKQQAMLTQELAHSKQLEAELAEVKQQTEANSNAHAFASELSATQDLEHRAPMTADEQHGAGHADYAAFDDGGSLLEVSSGAHSSSSSDSAQDIDLLHESHAEHDIDLAHTMDHAAPSTWEEFEGQLIESHSGVDNLSGGSGAAANAPDPSRFASSADYLRAMDTADMAEDMSPQQLAALDSTHEIGTPEHAGGGMHTLSEIDSLVSESASEVASEPFEFHPEQLKSPGLKADLSLLQDEEGIQNAMLKAQAKIKAIAAELEAHQAANGNADHTAGIEIDFDLGRDEPAQV